MPKNDAAEPDLLDAETPVDPAETKVPMPTELEGFDPEVPDADALDAATPVPLDDDEREPG